MTDDKRNHTDGSSAADVATRRAILRVQACLDEIRRLLVREDGAAPAYTPGSGSGGEPPEPPAA